MDHQPRQTTGRPGRSARPGRRPALAACLRVAGAILLTIAGGEARAVTPESPEVRRVVAAGLESLEKAVDDRYGRMLGGQCIVGLAFVKAGRPEHSRVLEAIQACRQAMTSDGTIDVYSNGLAVIFLCELDPRRYAREIQWYLDLMRSRQKSHGGWGYDGNNDSRHTLPTGDTSQTQYATLCYWTAHRSGFRIDGDSLERVADWLIRTQDPNGCWGYQGRVAPTSELIEQTEQSCSMLAAGLGSALICADLLNAVPAEQPESGQEPAAPETAVPPSLRRAGGDRLQPRPAEKLQAQRTDLTTLLATIDRAHGWMDENYEVSIGPRTYYYLYAVERYQSFQELLNGQWEDEPKWYNDGFELLQKRQKNDGEWSGYCGPAVDTAFSVLFLMRSTQKSIRASLGEGLLLSGRGLPANLARVKLQQGQVVVEQVQTQVDELLSMVDDEDLSRLDELVRDPSQLVVSSVDADSARQLQQLVRGGEPEVRLLAVRALGRTGNLDYVPSLVYALSDPDRRIVLEARNGLRFVSRRFGGFGPPDDFTEEQRFEAISAWKEWYLALRPGTVFEP